MKTHYRIVQTLPTSTGLRRHLRVLCGNPSRSALQYSVILPSEVTCAYCQRLLRTRPTLSPQRSQADDHV